MSARHKHKRAATPPPEVVIDENYRGPILTDEQKTAKAEILVAAGKPRGRHVLTGYAGAGKTTVLVDVVRTLAKGGALAVCAPTHKAVAVITRKLTEAGIEGIPCSTVQSLLSLEPVPGEDEKVEWRRRKNAEPITAAVVIIDECSMVGADLFDHIERYLRPAFVLFVGDPAQLPPVNEDDSPTFATRSKSHLGTVIRQEADNPVLATVTAIRALQDTDDMTWDWCAPAKAPPRGVYLPEALDLWLQKAFLSEEFRKDNDTFRYLCYTNSKVATVNARIRHWIYGPTDTPFSPGERVLLRAPIVRNNTVILANNEEAMVEKIAASEYIHGFKQGFAGVEAWTARIPSWEVTLLRDNGDSETVHMPRNDRDVVRVTDRLAKEARTDKDRWGHLYGFKNSVARLQHVYALTIHTSQGSTFKSVFVDLPDIKKRMRDNIEEMKRLLYVAASRPTTGLFFVT